MKSKSNHITALAGVIGLFSWAAATMAAPSVSRLTPPSALFESGDATPPIVSRFLPGQRFDLQATISPDPGRTITDVQFFVNGAAVSAPVSWGLATVPGK